MKTLILFICLSAQVSAESLRYELTEGNELAVDISSRTMNLNAQSNESIISSLLGFCGSKTCLIEENTEFTLDYIVSGASYCEGSDGTNEWQVTLPSEDGFHSVEIPVISDDTIFTLNCNSVENDITYTETTYIKIADSLSECSTSIYPDGLTPVEGLYRNYAGLPFGVSTTSSALLDIRTDEFYTLSGFNLHVEDFKRNIQFDSLSGPDHNLMDLATISVSECPGDFTESATCKSVISEFNNIFFSTISTDPANVFCILDPTKDYFFNIVMSPNPELEFPSCRDPNDNECSLAFIEKRVQQ